MIEDKTLHNARPVHSNGDACSRYEHWCSGHRRRVSVTPGPAARQAMKDDGALILFEDRLSDSPLVERVWRCHSERGGKFLSVAASHFEMVVTRYGGKAFLTSRGPETKATTLHCPPGGAGPRKRFQR